MRFVAKGTKFDPDNMKTFKEVYSTIENSCAVLKDMDDLVQEQGMGGLPIGFGNLDAVYSAGETLGSQSTTTKPRADFNQPILPMIRAKAMNLPAKISSQEIDEITEGLEKLQILQAVTERALQRVTTANVNARSYFSSKEDYFDKSIANINYRGF